PEAEHPTGIQIIPQCWASASRWTCGTRPMADYYRMSHIVGGVNAHLGAWPWMVSIQFPTATGFAHICGGSLMGEGVLAIGNSQGKHWMRMVIVHEHYTIISGGFDIALVEVDQPVQCGHHVQLACMPDVMLRVSQLSECFISGWGVREAKTECPMAPLPSPLVLCLESMQKVPLHTQRMKKNPSIPLG
uniref:Uncharacterized protein n=1 Tax=Melopsittacus undulatus TaxID=13146 RepID=A0A8V5FW30_MELUD